MVKLLYYDNRLNRKTAGYNKLRNFLDTGLPVGIDINNIYKQAKKYTDEK